MRGRIDDRACHMRLTHVDMVVSKQSRKCDKYLSKVSIIDKQLFKVGKNDR